MSDDVGRCREKLQSNFDATKAQHFGTISNVAIAFDHLNTTLLLLSMRMSDIHHDRIMLRSKLLRSFGHSHR
jgi:hypothetical protein